MAVIPSLSKIDGAPRYDKVRQLSLIWRLAGLLLLFFGFGCHGAGAGCSALFQRTAAKTAPDFSLPLLGNEGHNVVLSEIYRNQPVLLVFWATWCPSCVEEIPTLNEWQQKESAAKNFRILAVNVQESASQIQKLFERQSIQYPVVLDKDGNVSDQYGLVGLPASVLIAKGGKILYYGFSLPPNLDELLQHGGEVQ